LPADKVEQALRRAVFAQLCVESNQGWRLERSLRNVAMATGAIDGEKVLSFFSKYTGRDTCGSGGLGHWWGWRWGNRG